MTSLTFDTHFEVKELVSKGIPEPQAEAITQTIKRSQDTHLEQLATKADIDKVNAKIERVADQLLMRLGGLKIAIGGILLAYFELKS